MTTLISKLSPVQKSRLCQKLLDDAPTSVRCMAREVHENAYNVCKLRHLGLISVRKDADAILDYLLYWLKSYTKTDETGTYWSGKCDGVDFHFPCKVKL